MNKTQQVGIVILNYNNTTDLKTCVNSIQTHTPTNRVKIVVVDNGSENLIRDDIHSFLKSLSTSYQRFWAEDICNKLADINYLCIKKNVGYACGNNAGIDFLCQFDSITHIMILNSDIIFTEDIIMPLLQQMPLLPNVGAVSPLLYKPSGEIEHCCARKNFPISTLKYTFSYLFAKKYARLNRQLKIILQNPLLLHQPSIEIDLPSGSCMMFEKSTITGIEGFDPNTFLYYEENILHKKLIANNKQSYLIPSVSCIHVGGSTTTKEKTTYFLKKCNYDSLLYYIRTYEKVVLWTKLYIQLTGYIFLLRIKVVQILKSLKHQLYSTH